LIVRLFGIDPNADEEEVTEEEIRMMVDVGEEKGTIQENEKEMIIIFLILTTRRLWIL